MVSSSSVTLYYNQKKIIIQFDAALSEVNLSDLIKRAANLAGTGPESVKLIFGGGIMRDPMKSLEDYGIRTNSTVMLLASAAGITTGGQVACENKNNQDQKKTENSTKKTAISLEVPNSSSNQRKLEKNKKSINEQHNNCEINLNAIDQRISTNININKTPSPPSQEQLKLETALVEQIATIVGETILSVDPELERFCGMQASDSDRPQLQLFINEKLLQGLMKLDLIEFQPGFERARQRRREAVKQIQSILDDFDNRVSILGCSKLV